MELNVNELQNLKWLRKEANSIKVVRQDLIKISKLLNSHIHQKNMSENQKVKSTQIDQEISKLTEKYLMTASVHIENVIRMERVIEKIEDSQIRSLLRYLYVSDFTQTKIAMKMGVSVRTFMRWHDDFLEINL